MLMKIAKALHRRTKGEKGFTLIELIVVIAVLGILATLVVPRVVGVKEEAQNTVGNANLKIVKNALERYYAEHGSYPDPQDQDGDSNDNELPDVLQDDGYLDEIPTDLTYTVSNNNQNYTLEQK